VTKSALTDCEVGNLARGTVREVDYWIATNEKVGRDSSSHLTQHLLLHYLGKIELMR